MAKILRAKDAKILSEESATGDVDKLMKDIYSISSVGLFKLYNKTLSPAQVIRLRMLGYTLKEHSDTTNQYDICW